MTCRVRFGHAHVVNNRYDQWLMYAIGGSAHPTIFSQGNYFNASTAKQVRKELKLRKIYFDIPCANIHQEIR